MASRLPHRPSCSRGAISLLAESWVWGCSRPYLYVRVPRRHGPWGFPAGQGSRRASLNGGIVNGWGLNSSGQLGNNFRTNQNVPVEVSGL
jgi:hypothetical protein